MITRRSFLITGTFGAIAPRIAFAQARQARIGILGPAPFEGSDYAKGVVQGFTELGYAPGGRGSFEYRHAEGNAELYNKHAKELAALGCDLFIALHTEAAVRALQALRPAAPIVFLATLYDPVERGVVANLRRPDRNTTGISAPESALIGRRVEIIRELVPNAQRLLVFADSFTADQVEPTRKAVAAGQIQLLLVQFQAQPYDYSTYMRDRRNIDADAFMTLASPVFVREREIIREALMRLRLPSIGTSPQQAEAGYLSSFGINARKVTTRIAQIGARLLGGAKASEIPVEQADAFDLVLNKSTAQALGVKIPDGLHARATRLVK